MKLVIGQPVYERAWILPLWFDCLEAQELCPKEDITLCFVYSRSFDGTYDILRRRGEEYGNLMIYEYDIKAYDHREDVSRFHELAVYRNALLDMVKETDADYFLSWDNDILFKPQVLKSMFDIATTNSVIGAYMDMAGRDDVMAYPSAMTFGQMSYDTAYRRPYSEDDTQPFKTDVVMAVKLIGKNVYQHARYRWDPVGEDIGFCKSCEEFGYDRYVQPQARGIHLYDKQLAIQTLRNNKQLAYPDILEPLREWYKADD